MKRVNLVLGMVLGGLLMFPLMVWSQCPNLDFSYGNLSNWQCYQGSCAGGNYWVQTTNQIPGRVDIMNAMQLYTQGQIYDENCPAIKKVPDGYNFSCKIGNSIPGSKVDGIEYEMTVDSMTSRLVVNFAFVLQNVGHQPEEQPQFSIKITDSAGNVLNISCTDMVFTAGNISIPLSCDSVIQARDWTVVAYSLEQFIGQKIKIYFETRDCTQGQHWGYAYVTAECRPMRIDLMYCAGQISSRLAAPDGFESYRWTRSSDTVTWHPTTRQVVLQNPLDGEIFTCTLTSNLGCETEVKTVIRITSVDASFMFEYDTCTRTATFIDTAIVYNSGKNRIRWDILGLNASSQDSIFIYTFPEVATPTTYRVRLTVYAENGCSDTLSQSITIYPLFLKDSAYAHFTTPQKTYCNNENITFTNQSNGTLFPFFPHLACYSDIDSLTSYWDWGDGTMSIQKFRNGEYPTMEHRYKFSNNETKVVVRLTTGRDGFYTTDVFSDTLTIFRPVIADFTNDGHVYPCPGTQGIHITFTDSSNADFGIANYTWIFGDSKCPPNDNRAEGKNATNVSHLYKKAGSYDVTLIVEDILGCVDTMRKINHVFIDGPAGTFTYTPLSACAPFTATFYPDIEIGDNGFTVDTAIWFPDGITPEVLSGYNVTLMYRYNFKNAGYYLPFFLMIKWVDNNGTKERCVVVEQGVDTIWIIDLQPDFITEKEYGLDSSVEFINTTTVQPAVLQADSIRWDYGNGNLQWIYNTDIQSHNGYTSYNAEGKYSVVLTEYYKSCSQSKSYDIEVFANLGIEQLQGTSYELQVYPNPTSGRLQVTSYELQENSVVEIYDVVGQLLHQINKSTNNQINNEISIDVSHLAAGMYFLKISTEDGRQQTKKIVKY